jgi:glutamate/tyrosine decarboxylase-like PLP-dependent enzyme
MTNIQALPDRRGNVLPSPEALYSARAALITQLSDHGLGEEQTQKLLQDSICPALSGNSQTPNYYGFVTGGATPIAKFADNIVTEYDQTLHVHLPNETVATDVEAAALKLLCQLLKFDSDDFRHRIFTTGATASNLLGLACGRQWVILEAARRRGIDNSELCDVAKVGVIKAMRFAGIDEVQILTTVPHSSLSKAASIVGLGRDAVKTVNRKEAPHKFDLEYLEKELAWSRTASIVAVSCSEVNAGLFATTGEEMKAIRKLCDKHGAWLHVDGAFGIMGRCLDLQDEYSTVIEGCANMALSDSITGDAHKLLNVPYDCGFFFSKYPEIAFSVFQNAGAAYLSTGPSSDWPTIPSPLNYGLENSRRFRALPVYANLVAYGREGYQDMLKRQIALARRIGSFIRDHDGYELLPATISGSDVFIIVLFRATDEKLSAELVKRINATSQIYVSGTSWEGKPACRFAVSNWQVDVERDIAIIQAVLIKVWEKRNSSR